MNKEQKLIYNELMSKYNFDVFQKDEIELGIKSGVDITIYATPEFDWLQMAQIRYGLENNLDVSIYTKPDFNYIVTKNHNK